ncbi:MAG TPA: DUF739 family protein [Syntrophales bacterium]|nr:DUF739 family protein [Syntrophales bacterium]
MKRGPKPGSKTKTQLYKKLRAKLVEAGISHREFALLIHRCHAYVSQRMNGLKAWDTDDIYAACAILGIPHSEIHIYFPKDGKDAA